MDYCNKAVKIAYYVPKMYVQVAALYARRGFASLNFFLKKIGTSLKICQ
jgi:hypothetical protein